MICFKGYSCCDIFKSCFGCCGAIGECCSSLGDKIKSLLPCIKGREERYKDEQKVGEAKTDVQSVEPVQKVEMGQENESNLYSLGKQ